MDPVNQRGACPLCIEGLSWNTTQFSPPLSRIYEDGFEIAARLRRPQAHGFEPSSDQEMTRRIQEAHIPGSKPPVHRKSFSGTFRIPVIPRHHLRSPYLDFPPETMLPIREKRRSSTPLKGLPAEPRGKRYGSVPVTSGAVSVRPYAGA